MFGNLGKGEEKKCICVFHTPLTPPQGIGIFFRKNKKSRQGVSTTPQQLKGGLPPPLSLS